MIRNWSSTMIVTSQYRLMATEKQSEEWSFSFPVSFNHEFVFYECQLLLRRNFICTGEGCVFAGLSLLTIGDNRIVEDLG